MSPERNQPPPELVHVHHKPRSLDDTIEQYLGGFGSRQFLQTILVSFAWFFDAQQTFIAVFTDKEPKWSCNNNSSFPCEKITNVDLLCKLPRNSSSLSWDSPVHASIVSEWSLQCASPFIRGLPSSSFLLGCLVGGLVLATLADSNMGRKNTLILSSLIMSVSGGLTAISTNIWMYAGFRFLSGFGRSTIGTSAFVLASELVGKKWRGKIGIMGFSCFTLGFMSLPLVAFLLRWSSWRLIYFYTTCPCIFYSLLVCVFAYESPRWLFIKGKREEFTKTITHLTRCRSSISPSVEWTEKVTEGNSSSSNTFSSALKMLVSKNWALKRLLVLMIVGFGNGMAYYGSPLGLDGLPFNLYVSVALNALVELLAAWIMVFVIEKLKRKNWLVGLSLFSGVCGLVGIFARLNEIQIGLELVFFFSMCMAFDVFMIYVSELFPTCVRNSAVSMVRVAGLLGGFLGPMLVAVGRRVNGLLCYAVFGLTLSLTVLFVVLVPETNGKTLCDTMEEEEEDEYAR
ncbi:Organic cation/carnitine transporter 2 [Striga hermonthica]|uniref:Organic cation/carnitine transporter 2 n=1 Tax=Striga hermonthica TaxID=68872 RepID=A0A9N7NML2_STRHE|nr:Organic cation/carnitine transporter 2 [Striga hermonthica]